MSARVISFHYTLTDPQGETLDSSAGSDPLSFLEGGGQIIPGLESELTQLAVGDKRTITVAAQDAYGPRNPANIVQVTLDKLPAEKVSVGDRFRAGADDHAAVVTVTKVTETEVTLDANHPLAGLDLTFAVEITEVRDATDDETAHGHAHGAGGHHH